jgi:catalase
MQSQKGKLELGKEYPPPDEEDAIHRIALISEKLLDKNEKPVRRGQHPKHHGCVRAEFIVEANLPEKLRVGVFQKQRNFPACIRFSNARKQNDSKGGTHGMAIKILGVEGNKVLKEEKDEKTQDFVMMDHPVFFIRNVQDYVEFFEVQAKSSGKPPLQFFFSSLNPFKWRLHEFKILMSMQRKKIVSPLENQYWSTTPYQLGSEAIKFCVKSSPANTSGRSVLNTENYLREAMVEHLKNKEACFDFCVQLQTDPDKMPIEDPTIEWNEQESPYQKVATIKIPPQDFDSKEQMEFCEDLSYTPWHSLPEHMPLGGINRSRKEIYQLISTTRHELNNKLPKREPTEEEFFRLFGIR